MMTLMHSKIDRENEKSQSWAIREISNDWCKSLGKNIGLYCELRKDARNLILLPSDRVKSVD